MKKKFFIIGMFVVGMFFKVETSISAGNNEEVKVVVEESEEGAGVKSEGVKEPKVAKEKQDMVKTAGEDNVTDTEGKNNFEVIQYNRKNVLFTNEKPAVPRKSVTNGSILLKLVYYIPNRLIDLSDIFSLQLGCGPEVKTELRLTDYFQLGGSYGDRFFMVYPGYKRILGGGFSSGWKCDAGLWVSEYRYQEDTFGDLYPFFIDTEGFYMPNYRDDIYSLNINPEMLDPWEIGFGFSYGVSTDISIHPVEIADFITGFLFYDLLDDDMWQ